MQQLWKVGHIVKFYQIKKKKEKNLLTKEDKEEIGILMMTRSSDVEMLRSNIEVRL